MSYIANKVCRFAGRDFLKGEVVPDDLILESKKAQLIKTGVLTESTVNTDGKITIHISDMDLNLSEKELNQVFDYIGKNADESKEMIDSITSNDLLILLDHTETRKGMKEYIKNHATQLLNKE